MMIEIRYFAWVRSRIGHAHETLSLDRSPLRVRDLVALLQARGENYRNAFAHPDQIKIAVNQEFADLDHVIKPGDEVAFFPPVTGG